MKKRIRPLGLALLTFSTFAVAQSLRLEPVWEKNIFSDRLRPPLLGAVSNDGTLCLAMRHGEVAVLVDSDGRLKKEFRLEQSDIARMLSLSSLGFDPLSAQFWQWSTLARRVSVWTLNGEFVKSSSVLPDLANPQIFGVRHLYVRRPDQGSSPAIFSYSADLDEEILLWQSQNASRSVTHFEAFLSFVTSLDYLLVLDEKQLSLVNLTAWEEDQFISLPEEWFPSGGPSKKVAPLQVDSQPNPLYIKLLADHHNHFWVFCPNWSGLGVKYIRVDAEKAEITHRGILEDFPLVVDLHHFYFVEIEGPDEVIMRKVAFR